VQIITLSFFFLSSPAEATLHTMVYKTCLRTQGEVLLEVHNTHHFQAFLGEIRGALDAGSFPEYHAWFKAAHQQQSQHQELQQKEAADQGQCESQAAHSEAARTGQESVGLSGHKRTAWVEREREQPDGGEPTTKQKQQRTQL